MYLNELLLKVRSRVIPRRDGFAKIQEIVDDPVRIDGYHAAHATESCVLLFVLLRVQHGRAPLPKIKIIFVSANNHTVKAIF